MSAKKRTKHLDAHRLRVVAVESCSDPRTIRAYLMGKSVRPTSAARISRALAVLEAKGAA